MHYEDIKNIITRLETIAKSPVSEDPGNNEDFIVTYNGVQKANDVDSALDILQDNGYDIERNPDGTFLASYRGVQKADNIYDVLDILRDEGYDVQMANDKNESFEPFPETDEFDINEDEDFEEVLGVLGFPEDELWEAEYRGRKVKLNKPMRGDVKKFKVFVKDPKSGNVKKVNFGHGGTSAKKLGQKTMRIRKSDPARRRSFRARHNCANPGPKTKARYWSCRKW